MSIEIQRVTTASPMYQQVWQLREDVLRKPLGLSLRDEDLNGEKDEIIVIAASNRDVIGCVMLKPLADGVMKLRQMAVAAEWQGHGIGRMLVNEAEKITASLGYTTISLHARQVAIGFYERLGYAITSDLFTEVGIPHKKMEKMISAPPAS